jgi:16S rRNA (guanine527-N7)-methyltransferase
MDKKEILLRHLDLVIDLNKKTNLTAITDKEEGIRLHIEDSLLGLQDLNDAPNGIYGDMGTGAGYPGIPLAVISGRKTVLIDSVRKKTDALDYMINTLDLTSFIKTYNGRLEELALQQPQYFSALTARAVTQLPSLLELASPLLINTGRLICYKSYLPNDELDRAKTLEEKLGMKFLYCRECDIDKDDIKRCIVVFEKIKEPSVKLPRRVGMAQKKPFA